MRDGERTACWDYRQGGNRAAQFGAETEGQGNEHGAGVGSKKLAPASCFWPGSGPGSFAIYSVAYLSGRQKTSSCGLARWDFSRQQRMARGPKILPIRAQASGPVDKIKHMLNPKLVFISFNLQKVFSQRRTNPRIFSDPFKETGEWRASPRSEPAPAMDES